MTVDLDALKRDLIENGWHIYHETDFPEFMARKDEEDCRLHFWHQIHAGPNSVRIATYLDSFVFDESVQQMGVHVTKQIWMDAMDIIRRHIGPQR